MKYLRTVLFMAVIAGMILIMDYALVPSGYIRYIIHETNNAGNDDGYDNIIIGASHARSAINPVKLDEAGASDNAFNLAIPGETVTDSYYLLMESDRNNNVKRVIYDLDYQYWCNYADLGRDVERAGIAFEQVGLAREVEPQQPVAFQ